MPSIEKLFKGYPRVISGILGTYLSPDPRKMWLILSGTIGHITGTDTSFYVASKPFRVADTTLDILLDIVIPSATASGRYNIWNTVAGLNGSMAMPIFIDSHFCLGLKSGDSVATFYLQVLEFDI